MKSINLTLAITYLILFPLLAFANINFDFKSQSCKSDALNTQCDTQDAPSIFVLSALFANTTNPYPVELWENRDNDQINIFDIAREIKSIASHKEIISNNSDDSLDSEIIFQRLSQMEDIADRALIMEADKWKPHYVNELMKHIIGIRNTGISDLIPIILDPANCKDEDSVTNPCDENGTPWTSFSSLCNLNDEGPSIANYMQQHETDVQFISTWWTHQMTDSWDDGCRAVKLFYSNQRNLDPQTYYWGSGGYKAAEDEYSNFWKQGASFDDEHLCYPKGANREAHFVRAFTIWHAYVQEVLTKSKFYHNDQTNKQVCLTRTSSLSSLSRNNISQVGKGYIIPSATYDSFTLIKIYMQDSPTNKAIAESSVPHHRIIHLYPLLQRELTKEMQKLLREEKQALANFIVNKFYDDNDLRTLNLNSPLVINQAVEKLIYNQKRQALNDPFKKTFFEPHELEFSNYNSLCFRMLSDLPEIVTSDNLSKLLNNFLNEWLSDGNDCETEFVVLSGPDLPFDYFYNTTDVLSHFEKRLDSEENVCGFWPELKDLKQIGHLGGSTGAALYQDPKTGKKYVLKQGASEGHIREEFLADLLYAKAGFAIPECRLYETPEGPVKVASYLENSQPLYTAYYMADATEKQRLRNEIAKGFMLDALLVNFDVIGLEMDNVLVGNDGQVYRVDNGASFRYRAMGELKNDTPNESRKAWNPSPMALWSLRDPNRNPNGAEIFSDINIYEVAENIMNYYEAQTPTGINCKWDLGCEPIMYWGLEILLSNNTPELESQMKIRKENFKKVAVKALEMKAKGITAQEADIELRKWVESEDWGPAFE